MDNKGIEDDKDVLDLFTSNRITTSRGRATSYDTEDYKRYVEEESKNQAMLNARKEEKRKIQDRIRKQQIRRRWKAAGLTVLMGLGAAVTYGISQIPDFKNKVAEESLNTVKTSIADSVDRPAESVKIYDNSTMLSSNSGKTEYEVIIDNEIFYFRSENDGTTTNKIQDDIKNEDVLQAIADVANAQNGNIVETLRAKKTSEKIEKGEMNLDMSRAMAEREKDGFEIGD